MSLSLDSGWLNDRGRLGLVRGMRSTVCHSSLYLFRQVAVRLCRRLRWWLGRKPNDVRLVLTVYALFGFSVQHQIGQSPSCEQSELAQRFLVINFDVRNFQLASVSYFRRTEHYTQQHIRCFARVDFVTYYFTNSNGWYEVAAMGVGCSTRFNSVS